jgi:hypothetical protein
VKINTITPNYAHLKIIQLTHRYERSTTLILRKN